MFISFEGIDLSGKSTQIKLLTEYLKKRRTKTINVREPGGTAISEKIRDILLDKDHPHMEEMTEFLLFSSSRRQLTTEVIIPSLKKGMYVIADRYFDSSLAYQGYGAGLDTGTIKMINRIASAGREPDLTILLHIPVECWLERKKKQMREEDRIESRKKDYYGRVIDGYVKIARASRKRYSIIDGSRPVHEVHEAVILSLNEFEKKLSKK